VALQRVIGIAVVCGGLGVAAPFVAPSLVQDALAPHAFNAPTSGRLAQPAGIAPAPTPSSRSIDASSQTSGRTVALRADQYGQFEANAVINGVSVPVIVDTGATTVALSADTASRLGILPPQSAFRLPVSTANGTLTAAPVMLSEVRVGGIAVSNVQAVIIPGRALSVSLLGMTFLSRLQKFEIGGGQLTLRQ
jgi:aspartyl protease family protein